MRIIEELVEPGGASPNEDRCGHSGNLAWVIDGATDRHKDAALPAISDVVWLVDYLDGEFSRVGRTGTATDGRRLLQELGTRLNEELRRLRFPAERAMPVCSLAILLDLGQSFEMVRVGDIFGLVSGSEISVLQTDYFGGNEHRAVAASAGASRAAIDEGIHARRMRYIQGIDDESVFSGHDQRRLRFHRLVADWTDVGLVVMCSDGFARLVTDYGLYDWPSFLCQVQRSGLKSMAKELREFEAAGTALGPMKFKKSDDISAIVIVGSGSLDSVPEAKG